MNHNKITTLYTFTCIAVIAVLFMLVACNLSSDPVPAVGQSLPGDTVAIAKSRDIHETEYTPCLFLRGCGDEAIANIKPYIDVLAGAPIQRIMTDDCYPEMDHFLYLREHLPEENSALGGSGAPELIKHYFINGQTTLYVGKEGMISYIHTTGEPFEFRTWDELIQHIESNSL